MTDSFTYERGVRIMHALASGHVARQVFGRGPMSEGERFVFAMLYILPPTAAVVYYDVRLAIEAWHILVP